MPCPFDIHASLRTTIRRFYRNSRAPGHRPTGVVVFSIHTNRRWTSAGKSALTRPALAGRVVDRDNVDSQAAQRGFLVLVLHVGAGLAHGFDHFVEADEVGAVALQGQRGGGDGLDRAHAIALDAGDLHQAADRVAGHAGWCSMPISAAFSICALLPPSAATKPAAAIAQATPTSPWQPISAPEIDALRLHSMPMAADVSMKSRTPATGSLGRQSCA